MRLLPVIALALLSVQCHSELTTLERDTLIVRANQPQKEFNRTATVPPLVLLASPLRVPIGGEDDCGACETNSPIVNSAMARPITIEFDTSEPVNVIGIERTTNFSTWQQVYIDQPHLWIGLGHKQVRLTNAEPFAFYRVFVRNER